MVIEVHDTEHLPQVGLADAIEALSAAMVDRDLAFGTLLPLVVDPPDKLFADGAIRRLPEVGDHKLVAGAA